MTLGLKIGQAEGQVLKQEDSFRVRVLSFLCESLNRGEGIMDTGGTEHYHELCGQVLSH